MTETDYARLTDLIEEAISMHTGRADIKTGLSIALGIISQDKLYTQRVEGILTQLDAEQDSDTVKLCKDILKDS